MEPVHLRLIYDGAGPVRWSGRPADFGLQDKDGVLHAGVVGPNCAVTFDLELQLKPGGTGAPIFLGAFANGSPSGRFLYLSWRDARGGFAQRLKLPLGGITRKDVRHAADRNVPLVGTLVDHEPKATRTGANIGGTRDIAWVLP